MFAVSKKGTVIIMEFTELRRKILEDEYSHLNNMQKQAVFFTDKPLLILAGAGSGKTTVIVNKIGYLIKYGRTYSAPDFGRSVTEEEMAFLNECLHDKTKRQGSMYESLMQENPINARNLLAITFTNKAAGEMRDRIEKIFNISASDLWALTFHSLCVRILRQYIYLLGYDTNFTIYDEADSNKLMDGLIKDLNLGDQYKAKVVRKIISRAKTSYQSPESFKSSFKEYSLPKIPLLYEMYQNALKEANALDFDDLIFNTVKLLSQFDDVRAKINKRFRYVLVDEYQDTNPLQYKLVSLLVSDGKICVVGDDDQSIYKFMGASIDNILSFESSFKNANVIRLEQNYRSTKTILEAANEVIKHNTARKGKNLWTDSEGGNKIKYFQLSSQQEEADYIAKTILTRTTRGLKYKDFCVLYRTHSQSNSIELALKGNGIPYRVFGGLAFLKRKEIQDILAYFNIIVNPHDKIRLLRIINEPKRGIGDTTLNKIDEIAQSNNMYFFDVMKNAGEFSELARAKDKLVNFVSMIEDLQQKSQDMKISELFEYMLEKTGYLAMLSSYDQYEARARKDNLQELLNSLVLFEKQAQDPTLIKYLEETALVSAVDNMNDSDDAVVLMTMHCAKGLEFDTVFISGFEEGLFPSSQSVGEEDGVEEERRLCYVAITRAKKSLYILSARSRMMYGNLSSSMPSRFLKEIPLDLIEEVQRPKFERNISVASKRDRPKQILTGSTDAIPKKQTEKTLYENGMRVRHKVFGTGVITSVTNMSSDTLLEVEFESAGKKKLMANFAKMEII